MFLPFYDWNNLSVVFIELGTFTNTAPVVARVAWPGGFFTLAPFSLAYLAYFASGYQIYWTIVVLKTVVFGFSISSAWILYRIGLRHSPAAGPALAAFVLFNPVMLFLGYIWVIWDVYPIFFLLLGYYLLRYQPISSNDRLNLLAATAAVMLAVFFYWYALVAIPVFLFYSPSVREKLWLLTYSVAMFGILMLINVVLFVGSPVRYFTDFVGASPTFRPISLFGLPAFVTLGTVGYLALVAAIVLILPLVLHRFGFSEPVALFAVILLFVWSSTAQTPDNYAWVFWFTPLVFLRRPNFELRWYGILGSMAVPLLGILFAGVDIENSPFNGQGIFYYGYDLFHSTFQFLPTPAARTVFLDDWNIVVAIALTISLAVVLWMGRPSRVAAPPSSPDAVQLGLNGSSRPPKASRPRTVRQTVLTVGIAVVIVAATAVGALEFNEVQPNLLNYGGSGPLPLLMLQPAWVPNIGNSLRPISNVTYTLSGPNITIYPTSLPLGFALTPNGRSLAANLSFQLAGAVPTDSELVVTSGFDISLVTLRTVDEGVYPQLRPSTSVNVTNLTLGYPLMNVSGQIMALSSTSDLAYAINNTTLSGSYLYWAFQFARSGGEAVPVFELTTSSGTTTSLLSLPDFAVLNYGAQSPVSNGSTLANAYSEISRQWNYVGIHESGSTFWLDFNGVVETVPAPWMTGNMTLRLAQTTSSSGTIVASNFRMSPIYDSTGSLGASVYSFLNWTNTTGGNHSYYEPTPPHRLNVSVASGPAGTRVWANGGHFDINGSLQSVMFGKASPGNYSVNVTVHELNMKQFSVGYYLVPVFVAMVALFSFPAWVCWRVRTIPTRPGSVDP